MGKGHEPGKNVFRVRNLFLTSICRIVSLVEIYRLQGKMFLEMKHRGE